MKKKIRKLEPLSLDGVKSYPLNSRRSKVTTEEFGQPWQPGGGIGQWVDSLPRQLAGINFREIVDRIIQAVDQDRPVILGMGAHVIKVGLNPILIDLMDRGIIHGIAMNGAGIIHDSECAMVGRTSEDVAAHLGDGTFGMAEETGRLLNEAITAGAKSGIGLGEAVGKMLVESAFPYTHLSLLARAYQREIPLTVHAAVGTDIIHFHPSVDGGAVGKTSHHDFRLLASQISGLEGGVFINLGSAVIIPEVFLKALSLVRNLGHEVKHFTTVNMDFIRHYRPMTNVVQRPTMEGGRGYALVGHHEIMFPLLAAAIIEGLERR